MSRVDIRSRPESEWTYYVVGHLPTMEDFFRVDTVQEAVDLFRSMPSYQRSAIGASIHGTCELDLIHRREGNTPVLVTDFASEHASSVWTEPEIQASIDHLIALLGVQHQYNARIFRGLPSIIVDLDRYKQGKLDPYFSDKQLDVKFTGSPSISQNANNYIDSIQEVYLQGKGWMDRDQFLSYHSDSRPKGIGQPARDVFVGRINIRYRAKDQHIGQADLSPHEFEQLVEKTERERRAGERAPAPSGHNLCQRLHKARTEVLNHSEEQPIKSDTIRER